MKRAALLAALSLGACAPGGDPSAAMTFALGPDLATTARSLQIVFVRRGGGSLDCTTLQQNCVRLALDEAGLRPEPLLGPEGFEGKSALLVPVEAKAASEREQQLRPEVSSGTFTVVVEAIDAAGKLAGNACELSVTMSSGQTTALTLHLGARAVACDAAFP